MQQRVVDDLLTQNQKDITEAESLFGKKRLMIRALRGVAA